MPYCRERQFKKLCRVYGERGLSWPAKSSVAVSQKCDFSFDADICPVDLTSVNAKLSILLEIVWRQPCFCLGCLQWCIAHLQENWSSKSTSQHIDVAGVVGDLFSCYVMQGAVEQSYRRCVGRTRLMSPFLQARRLVRRINQEAASDCFTTTRSFWKATHVEVAVLSGAEEPSILLYIKAAPAYTRDWKQITNFHGPQQTFMLSRVSRIPNYMYGFALEKQQLTFGKFCAIKKPQKKAFSLVVQKMYIHKLSFFSTNFANSTKNTSCSQKEPRSTCCARSEEAVCCRLEKSDSGADSGKKSSSFRFERISSAGKACKHKARSAPC